ncbi:hypothetical protein Ahy_A02g007871 isoform B [Arachis hypogaea]|uniref:Vacuolar ATPase assembly integral membrane protein VMA21 homolog n=2 Tax=Arachis TaxID=3817 RepID=A0A445EDB5_ARAHY|nr:hypothetical protein Ahy_A02g007871 isoform B [Arachis hypogaea]
MTCSSASSFPPDLLAISCVVRGSNLLQHERPASGPKATMSVIQKFFIASMFMWVVPVAILYGFNNNLFPGADNLSPYSVTLVSGFLAVISVNVVIAFYIYLAMKEPAEKHEPDPKFLAEAKASMKQPTTNAPQSSESQKKEQ